MGSRLLAGRGSPYVRWLSHGGIRVGSGIVGLLFVGSNRSNSLSASRQSPESLFGKRTAPSVDSRNVCKSVI
eukprot:6649870-Pyramimonas_sp.AAC.1